MSPTAPTACSAQIIQQAQMTYVTLYTTGFEGNY